MVPLPTTLTLLFSLASLAAAQQQISCDPEHLCPQSSPCCSSYGICGVGAYCLGGCDPQSSFNLNACMAEPVCATADYSFTSLDGVAPNTQYLGDASKSNWVSSGQPVEYNGQSMLLTMAPNTVGTLVSSTNYVWYGKISANMTTSQSQGVVTAFIMMSDMKDEIDFEFVGTDLTHAQSNYYWQGVTDYNNMLKLNVSNTVDNFHVYEIDWTPESLTWSIDGVAMRTLDKNSTYNETDHQYHYPQTPARVQLSLWPAGLSTNAEGTIEWAGGLVNWNSPAMANGYFYAQVASVNVECYNPPADAQISGTKSYTYSNVLGIESDVVITNNNTILGSFQADGLNQDYNPAASSTSGSSSSTPSSNANTVPGVSGAGSYGDTGNTGSTTSGGDSGSSSAGSAAPGYSGGFIQGTTSTGGASRLVAGSVVAMAAVFASLLLV